jgi:hypothetical protein
VPPLTRLPCPLWVRSVVDHVGQQGEEAGALDGLGQLALLLAADRRDAGGDDLAALAEEADRRRTSLWSIFGAWGPENGQDFLRR